MHPREKITIVINSTYAKDAVLQNFRKVETNEGLIDSALKAMHLAKNHHDVDIVFQSKGNFAKFRRMGTLRA